jgi:hypothetical protein
LQWFKQKEKSIVHGTRMAARMLRYSNHGAWTGNFRSGIDDPCSRRIDRRRRAEKDNCPDGNDGVDRADSHTLDQPMQGPLETLRAR